MTLVDDSPNSRRVAVGHTHAAAVAAFAVGHDDLFVTTYADLAQEVDLDEVQTLDLAPGDGFTEVFAEACRRLHEGGGLVLRIAHVPENSASLDALLERASVRICDVQESRGHLLMEIGVAQDSASHASNAAILADLDAAARVQGGAAAVEEAVHAKPGAPKWERSADRLKGRRGRTVPRLVVVLRKLRRRVRGRRRLVLAAGVLCAVLMVAVAALTYSSGVLLALTVPMLLAAVAAGTGIVVVAVLLLARQVHAQTGRIEKMLLRNRALSQAGSGQLLKRIRAVEASQQRYPFAQDYLEAMAAASSSGLARLAEQVQDLSVKNSHSVHVTERLGAIEAQAVALHLDTQRQVQALLNLGQLVGPKARLPTMGGWAASPDFALLTVQELISTRPRVAVECGSGTTTLLMALAAREHGLDTRIVALEHQEVFRRLTEQSLVEHGVSHLAEVRLAPLRPTTLSGHPTPWYDQSAIVGLRDIGLLVVDGPPEATGPRARYPAVPLLADRFSERVSIVVDDQIRLDDREVVQAWRTLLPDFDFQALNTFQKHAAVFRRGLLV